MTRVYIGVEGARELAATLKAAGDYGLLDALLVANGNAAEIVVDESLPDIPFRHGGLRGSARALANAKSGRAVAGGLRDVPYAAAIHWGRQRGNVGSPPGNRKGRNPIKGRPFLWNAAQRSIPRIEPEYRNEIMRIMELATRSANG